MKPITSFALLCAFAAVAQGAVTTPVGYVTENIATGFNLIGLTLHEPVTVVGTVSGVDADSIAASASDFSTALTPGVVYLLEFTSGAQNGAIQVFDTFSSTEITTEDDLLAAGVLVGDTFKIRPAATIASVFGDNNEAGLQASDSPTGADIIWVPNGVGYDQYYRNQGLVIGETVIVPPSWQTLSGSEAGDAVLPYSDGLFIERKGSATSIVVTGEVKMTSTRVALPTGFTVISSGFPVGSTLDNSGLQNFLAAGDSPTSADVVWIPTGPGSYDQFYYNQGLVIGETVIVPPSWQTLGGAPAGSTTIPSAVFIQRKGSTADALITVPYNP